MLIAGMYVEFIMNYNALLEGKAPVALGPTGSHEDFLQPGSRRVPRP